MTTKIVIHFDNFAGFSEPELIIQTAEKGTKEVASSRKDEFGEIFELEVATDRELYFKFADKGLHEQEDNNLVRTIAIEHIKEGQEFWCRGWNKFVYVSEPQHIANLTAEQVISNQNFIDGIYISNTDGRYALGATLTVNGTLFAVYHPHASRIWVTGDFNDWQYPNAENPNPKQFLEMTLHQGYFGAPNIWYAGTDKMQVGDEYKFYIEYNCLMQDTVFESRLMVDPYARFLGMDYSANNSLLVDPSAYQWHDEGYSTPAIHDLIIYELHVHGFTHAHPDIVEAHQGKYQGIIDRINAKYFDDLGVTCLYLMPISEVPTPQGEDALGYNSSLFMSIERDFGTPDDLRQLVDTAHQHGLALIVDQVFNHSANSWNPLWQYILDDPNEMAHGEGGIYFSGSSPWGNRLATERTETQNMLIDACKMMILEYHIDGFRFDATHSMYIDHSFMQRLADELQAFKPDVILIAENLPNETDLNRQGFDGYGQWCDFFHDTIKAFLREGEFEGSDNEASDLADIFYFSKGKFATHTNNVVNYCESHDEHSVAHEVGFVENLNSPQAKERKARLGLFATMVALGQPMMYMGQEFGTDRERNKVYFDFPENLAENGFYQWASRLINLRRRYPALKLYGFNPIEDGQFKWIIGSWLSDDHGASKRVLGWRSTPTEDFHDAMVIFLNLENHPVEVDIHFGIDGHWVRLASIDEVDDIPPHGNNSPENDFTIQVTDGVFRNFVMPDSSAFIYKWESGF